MSGGRRWRVARWVAYAAMALAVTVWVAYGISVGVTALVGGDAGDVGSRSDVGQSLEAANSVFSGLALFAVIGTVYVQQRDQRHQRRDLMRSAESGERLIHLELLRMAIDDPELAEVWPEIVPGLSAGRNRQYLYANLILAHQYQWLESGRYTEADVRANLRILFKSPLIVEFLIATRPARAGLAPGGVEFKFYRVVEEVAAEVGNPPF